MQWEVYAGALPCSMALALHVAGALPWSAALVLRFAWALPCMMALAFIGGIFAETVGPRDQGHPSVAAFPPRSPKQNDSDTEK